MSRIGFVALAAKWFWDTQMSDSSFTKEALSTVEEIATALRTSDEIISAGLVTTEEAAASAASKFKEEDVDVLVACCFMWSEDQPLFKILEVLNNVPLLLWCWTPGRTLPKTLSAVDLIKWGGPVGAQQISGALRRSGREFKFVLGSHTEEEKLREINSFARAAAVAKSLRHTKIGLLPYRYAVMTNTWTDEFRLMSEFGIDVTHISVAELASSSATVNEEEVGAYIRDLEGMPMSPNVPSEGLRHAVRVSLGLAKIVGRLNVSAISISDANDELHAVLACRPCLYLPSVFERGVVVSSEGDLMGTVAQLFLTRLSGEPTIFTEIFTYDESRNEILVGHAGMADIRLAESRSAVAVTKDYEYPKETAGVWMSFSIKPGPVTLLSIADTKNGFHFVVARGRAVRAKGKLQGYPCGLIRLDTPLKSFFQRSTGVGTTQHWAVSPGDHVEIISNLARVLGVDCTILC
jgi:L-arabinose isomerase